MNEIDHVERAKRFREARNDRNINGKETLRTVVEETMIPKSTICNMENEKSKTNIGYIDIVNLANHYGVNVAWLMGQSDSPSLNEDVQAATKVTGLSSDAIEKLSLLGSDEIACLNALLASYDFRKALSNLSYAKLISNRIEAYIPPQPEKTGTTVIQDEEDGTLYELDDYSDPPQTADEYADIIEGANMFEIKYDHKHDKSAPDWAKPIITRMGTGNTISDRQLVRMYRNEALQDIGNAFRVIAPASEDERTGK